MKDDIQERWETSQNPWVYRAQGVIDSVFAETEIGSAIRFEAEFPLIKHNSQDRGGKKNPSK